MLTRNLPVKGILQFSFVHILAAIAWSSCVVAAVQFLELKWLAIPFLPISLIGTAVSFYLGFKNNAANERQNEARKNWGAITNDTRAFTAMLDTYLPKASREADALRTSILKRHIAWLHAHASFLRHKRMEWEHDVPLNTRYREQYRKDFGISLDIELGNDLARYLPAAEVTAVQASPNAAVSILRNQSMAVRSLRDLNLIEDFRLFELQNHMTKLFEHQGKNERIKTFPIPRQFASYSRLFVNLFVFLLPFGLAMETQAVGIWATVPFATLITWVFTQMELIGEYSEHPFEGLIGDIPITAITRNLEIEILHALGETELPKPVVPVEGVLL